MWKSSALGVGMYNGSTPRGNVQYFLKNLKLEFPCDPEISLLGLYY